MTSQSINSGPQTVVAVERAFSILQTIAAEQQSMGISAIARSTGLAKSTVSRLLTTLDQVISAILNDNLLTLKELRRVTRRDRLEPHHP